MKVEMWAIDQVKPYENNPRINDGAVDAVAASIREFGFRVPIVVDRDGVIVAGHTRLKAAEKVLADAQGGEIDPGIASIYRRVQGLASNDDEYERKKGLMAVIYQANRRLQKELV